MISFNCEEVVDYDLSMEQVCTIIMQPRRCSILQQCLACPE